MQSHGLLNRILAITVAVCFVWFFASSVSIAYQKCLQHDDAMFATIPKNFLNGYGWATSYGEKIPFNPDVSTGPTLWIPAALMIAAFGNQAWVPAMTGTVMNIILTLLVLWQLCHIVRHKAAAALALLLAISLFAVNDFKTFTGYYSASLLFLFSLLFVLNDRYKKTTRLLFFGAMAAIGLYGKPLILLSYLAAAPFVVFCCADEVPEKIWRGFPRSLAAILLGFVLMFSPWYFYKNSVMAHEQQDYRAAYQDYAEYFFEFHGSGVGQFHAAENKLAHLTGNSEKNYNILEDFLQNQINFPIYALLLTLLVALLMPFSLRAVKATNSVRVELRFTGILACVIIINLLWYVIFSFAMTPGHAFFLTLFSLFLLFFLMATQSRSNAVGVALCLVVALVFQVRHPALVAAYTFKASDIYMSNLDIYNTRNFLMQHVKRYPLASCGWSAGPWRLEYLLPPSQSFVDCFNVLEDSLILDEQDYLARNPGINLQVNGKTISPTEHFFTQGMHHAVHATFHWHGSPDFTFAVDNLSVFGLAQFASYVLTPMGSVCARHILFATTTFTVCEVPFGEYKDKLDPTETARHLVDYQGWYRTRIKVY